MRNGDYRMSVHDTHNLKSVDRSFFEREAASVARSLVGLSLVRILSGHVLVGIISETEAYLGEHDPAAHVSRGRTPRTEVLYGPAGHAYVYQMHRQHLLNISADFPKNPGCVLIRGVIPVKGVKKMRELRKKKDTFNYLELTNGPGKLCQAFSIIKDMYGTDLTDSGSDLFVTSIRQPDVSVVSSGRVGVSTAQDWRLRFYIGNVDTVVPDIRLK